MSSTSSVIDVVPVPLVPPVKLSSALVIFCMGSSAVTSNCRLASTSCVLSARNGPPWNFNSGIALVGAVMRMLAAEGVTTPAPNAAAVNWKLLNSASSAVM